MANEWYVQHGGKEHGPITSATLKKLAGDGKITPITNVRLGAQGNWVPASRVQGLFSAAQVNSLPPAQKAPPRPAAKPAKAAPPPAPVAPPEPPPLAEADDEFADLLDMPMAVPQAVPVAQAVAPTFPRATPAALPKATPVDGASIAPKVVGGVGLIFGAIAWFTCWLPVLGHVAGLMAWTGIVAGTIGLLLGGIGLWLAAVNKGSGLLFGIFGAGSSAVGLVLTIVLGAMFGLFTGTPKPAPIVVPQPVAVAPPVHEEPPPPQEEPEPEPPPEPVWTDANEPIQLGDVKARIVSVKVENLQIEDITTFKKQKPKPMLRLKVSLENTSTDKIIDSPGWPGGADLVGGGLGNLLGDAAKEIAKAVPIDATLIDNAGNKYKQTPTALIFGGQLSALNQDNSIRPAAKAEKELLFSPPLETIEYLRLELPGTGFMSTDSLRFQIPKAMIAGMATSAVPPAPAGGQ